MRRVEVSEILAAARTWLGTPWSHQGRLKGVSVDCGGLTGKRISRTGSLAEGVVRSEPFSLIDRHVVPQAGKRRLEAFAAIGLAVIRCRPWSRPAPPSSGNKVAHRPAIDSSYPAVRGLSGGRVPRCAERSALGARQTAQCVDETGWRTACSRAAPRRQIWRARGSHSPSA
jgi:hypothetical protein